MPDRLFRDNAEPIASPETTDDLMKSALRLASDFVADEMTALRKENAELRQKAENNNICYIAEMKWADRVGKILSQAMPLYSVNFKAYAVSLSETLYNEIMQEYKDLGHFVG